MIKILKKAAGAGILALIDDCRSVDEKIAGRKLAQLKPVAAVVGEKEMPKAYYVGVTTYFGSALNLFYALFISYTCLAVAAKPLPGGWAIIAGLLLFVALTQASSGVTKGRTYCLRLFLAIWSVLSVCNVLVAGWLLFAPFSWLCLGTWAASTVLLWLARRSMNGSEMRKLMRWRVSLRAAQFRRQALTQPKGK